MRAVSRSSLTLPIVLTAVAAVVAWFLLGPGAALALVALTLLEIAMAADSSVPMAGIASRLHSPARRLFLSIGIVAGVLAMRLLLPPAAVAVSTPDPAAAALSAAEAVVAPGSFAAHFQDVRPALAAFGASFIWLVFAEYLFNTDRASRRAWLGNLEARLARVRRPRMVQAVTAGAGALVSCALVAATSSAAAAAPLFLGGVLGMAVYALSKVVAARAIRASRLHRYAATVVFERGLVVFMLFEVLDGVYTLSAQPTGLGAWRQAVVAAAAVAIGAVFLAMLTTRLDSAAGLKRFRYLKAGAAYVLGVLAVLLWTSLVVPIPGVVVGWFGSVVIGLALATSIPWRRRSSRLRTPGVAKGEFGRTRTPHT